MLLASYFGLIRLLLGNLVVRSELETFQGGDRDVENPETQRRNQPGYREKT